MPNPSMPVILSAAKNPGILPFNTNTGMSITFRGTQLQPCQKCLPTGHRLQPPRPAQRVVEVFFQTAFFSPLI